MPREGKERVEPAGSDVDEFIDFALMAGGEVALLLRLRVFDVLPTEGLYLGDRLLALRTGLVGAPEVPAGTTWDGFGLWPSGERTLFVPASPSLVDLQLFAQGIFVAPPGGARSLLLTNGLLMEIGAP